MTTDTFTLHGRTYRIVPVNAPAAQAAALKPISSGELTLTAKLAFDKIADARAIIRSMVSLILNHNEVREPGMNTLAGDLMDLLPLVHAQLNTIDGETHKVQQAVSRAANLLDAHELVNTAITVLEAQKEASNASV